MAGTLRRMPGCRLGLDGGGTDGSNTLIVDRYELSVEIGAGSFGRVFKARDTKSQRDVAIKHLYRDVSDTNARDRFLREMDLLTRLRDQPHIVQIYEHGESHLGLFIVMELILGYSLSYWLCRMKQEQHRSPPQRIMPWFDQICRALGAAHSIGIIHRDIKPSNIMVARSAGHEEQIKVLDFGVARCGERTSTRTGERIGTHGYMSPEQALGRCHNLSPASDVFSLGVLLVEMLAPASGPSCEEFLFKKKSCLRTYLRTLRTDIPDRVWTVLMKALDLDPERRFQDAEELRQALGRAMRGGPALPPSRSGPTSASEARLVSI